MAGTKRPRRSGATKRRVKRRTSTPRPSRWLSMPRLVTSRKFFLDTWQFGTAATNDFWRYYIHRPSEMPNWGEYASLFDEYRLNAVKVTFLPRYDSVDVSAATPMFYGHTVIDSASTMIPAGTYGSGSLNVLMENSGVRTRSLSKPVSIYYRPKIAMQAFGGATNVYQTVPKFLKTNDTSVDYRGFHMYLQGNQFSASGSNVKLDVFVTYYLTFRNTR